MSGKTDVKRVRGVIFAGGGTGGHIFPGMAVAEQLEQSADSAGSVACRFAISTRPLDAQILRQAGREFVLIPAQPFAVRPRGLFKFIRSWGGAVHAGQDMIRRMRLECPGGVEVISMGGFVAAPVVQAARKEGARITLVNLDAVPGRANRWISRHSDRVYSTVAVPEGSLRGGRLGTGVVVVPPIVRSAARASGDAAACRRLLGLDPDRPTIMVTGASQGARSINSFMLQFAEHSDLLQSGGWQVVHQTGKGEAERVREGYRRAGVHAVAAEFFEGMGTLWGAADIAVSRSGAGSVAEAWANRVPTIFLPYPYHKDQHQKFNAMGLAQAGAAMIVHDRIEPQANMAEAGTRLMDLCRDPGRRAAMRCAYDALGPADGEVKIARGIASAW
ncbi:MAG TPA: UDP-N-acetylglucosamine--N-acetylmuramyl-(pentapeptide) pyrophosphoryl-undecaprenol N-acetylglucosamine transferase [Phycisphaerales bacterium]|nr:UDP-N-acetylglucosamine--N-acetylmuramyl-(pentapeptide) pyrophosphoryl-undecaprenol N-acetylglucosamine transferase [Phycisphaerales bacterium]